MSKRLWGPFAAMMFGVAALAAASVATAQGTAPAPAAQPQVEPSGAVVSPGARFPFSVYASPQALAVYARVIADGRKAPPLFGPVEASRKFYADMNDARAERSKQRYPVKITPSKIDGVGVDIVDPLDARPGEKRVLINLHGGAFLWGAGSGGLVESVPIANLSKIEVISVDYRQGPEYQFPAASEDVEKVYRALLKTHRAQDIGIYGCSAGGILTAEAVAWFAKKNLPRPGAIGIFCAGIVDMNGDSVYLSPLLMGDTVPKAPWSLTMLPYFKNASASDPLVWPGASNDVIAKFPPTLLVSGTRDFAMSALLRTNELLSDAGVATEVHVFEGMWHSFFSDPEMPESDAAYHVMARFFLRHLGADAHGGH